MDERIDPVSHDGSGMARSGHMPGEETQTIISHALPNAPIGINRVFSGRRDTGLTAPYEREEAWLVVLQLIAFDEQDLWVGGRPAPYIPFRPGALIIYDLERNWVANLKGEFDCLQFYIPRLALDSMAEEEGARPAANLYCPPHLAAIDPTVHHLGRALLPALAHPERASQLFVDHLSLALQAHLAHTYGEARQASPRVQQKLAPWQEQRAKALLRAHLEGEITLEALARECGLSRSHFARAFSASTGMPPHRWLVFQRVELAKSYLRGSDLRLGEIAQLCGFADQSHFTRTFARTVGVNPKDWRRLATSV